MRNLVKNHWKGTNSFLSFYLLAAILLWLKTYMTQQTQFQLNVQGLLQQFLLFINPLGSALLFLGLSFLFNGRKNTSGSWSPIR